MIAEKAWIIWNPDPTIYLHPLLHHSTNDTILTRSFPENTSVTIKLEGK
jgi:hypothetical protein